MKKSLVLAMTMAMGISATAFAANPFSDVPQGHWAYASINKLAAAGIVDGYPDGTFKGDHLLTRYEMAQIVAKAYAKGAIKSDDKLMAEFADELDNLGVGDVEVGCMGTAPCGALVVGDGLRVLDVHEGHDARGVDALAGNLAD